MHYSPKLKRFISTPASARPIPFVLRIIDLLLCWENLFPSFAHCFKWKWDTVMRSRECFRQSMFSAFSTPRIEIAFIIANNNHDQHLLNWELLAKSLQKERERGWMFHLRQNSYLSVASISTTSINLLSGRLVPEHVSGLIWGICSSLCCLLMQAQDSDSDYSCLICGD